ncbi:hypothetical protein [Paenarthrobacter sp. YJN-5]|uniref:hypothetical protein n=1 Tax=Paenarthrobacter sp. YJN-5 TaxID=2735316 RepID=UPI001877E974|nr:hypothetical protein [Paenarthrobacter sp. YJN-5]QOT19442.1 hypothetical protein HMI59_22600 [Paenarthrobacter sp. YJN-5]
MSAFEDMVNDRAAELSGAAQEQRARDDALRDTYASAAALAAQNIRTVLADACGALQRRGVPTSLAVTIAGPDGARWHFVAEALGWNLQRGGVNAFLTVDGRICMEHGRMQMRNDFLSTTQVRARFEKATLIKPLVNPHQLVPASGQVIDLHARQAAWLGPDRLVEAIRGETKVLFPISSYSTLGLDFTKDGQVLVHDTDWDTVSFTPLERWLADAVGSLIAEQIG